MMFFSGFLRKKIFRFSPGMTIILSGRHFLQEGYLPAPDRCQSAAFPLNHMVLAPPLPFFLLFLICVTLLLDKSLHFLLLFSSKTGRISSGTTLERIKIFAKTGDSNACRKVIFRCDCQKGRKNRPTTCFQVIGHMPLILFCILNKPVLAVRLSESAAPDW